MRIYTILILIVLSFSSQSIIAQEIRVGAKAIYPITKQLKSSFTIEQRFAEQGTSGRQSSILQTKLSYKLNKYFSYSIGLRYKKEQSIDYETNQIFNNKLRITADLKVKIPEHVKGWSLYNRTRLQQSRTYDKYRFYIRNQSSLKYKYSKHLSTNLSYELIYSMHKQELVLGRFKTEVEHEILKHMDISAYFIIDSPLGNQKWDHNYIVGSQLAYRF